MLDQYSVYPLMKVMCPQSRIISVIETDEDCSLFEIEGADVYPLEVDWRNVGEQSQRLCSHRWVTA